MRKLIFATIFIGISFAVNAQYRKNFSFHPNWYIGANVGQTTYWGEEFHMYMTFEPQKSFGWIGRTSIGYNFTPVIGLRGFYGYSEHNWPKNTTAWSFTGRNLTADMTVDITNWLEGYDRTRVFNLVVFGGSGVGYHDKTDSIPAKLTFILRGGMQGDFHLSQTVDLNLIGESNIVRDDYNGSVVDGTPFDVYPAFTLGITYHFGQAQHNYKMRRHR
jgi:OmpA-OmpF porin, OOP family